MKILTAETFWFNGLACVMVAMAFGVELAVGKSILWKIMLLIFLVANGVFFLAGIVNHNREVDRYDLANRLKQLVETP